jgi:CheY-like chemotaxis protein
MGDLTNIIKNHDFKGKKVLIADSDFSSIKYAVKVLGNEGVEVISTNNGNDAVNIVSEENIDIAFVNIWLPLKNGYDVIREIRNFNNNKSKIPIIACSTGSEYEEKEKCVTAGCDDYLLKPVYPKQFLDMLRKYLG